MQTLFVVLIVIGVQQSKSDDIYLKGGFVVRNCQVLDTTDEVIRVLGNGKEYLYDDNIGTLQETNILKYIESEKSIDFEFNFF